MISLILSGGIGSRLWPVSREKLPKQFSPLFAETLFTTTARRLQKLGDVQVCTSAGLRALTEKAIRQDQLKISKVYYEPVGRNTAPAIALVCYGLKQQGRENEVLGVFPSDHWIENEKRFAEVLKVAEDCANKGQIVTIGIQPDRPATGFGYVDCRTEVFQESGDIKAFMVNGFKEKPEQEVAAQYLAAGHYYWNSGMFVFKVQTMIDNFEKHMPELWQGIHKLNKDLSNIGEMYPRLPSQSIDYGIMEKASEQVNIPCAIGWSDLGSWDDVANKEQQEAIPSETELMTLDSKNCFAFSEKKKLICLSDVDDLIVVDTDDALLVTRKGKSQNVKKIVEKLKSQTSSLATDHTFEYRPWGMYQNLYEEEQFKTKVIDVDPGQQLSYQSHTKRAEIWVVVSGSGEVVLNDEILNVSQGKIVSIPAGAKHRMRNTGQEALKFVEVQLGSYFGEDDIKRYQDDYQRL